MKNSLKKILFVVLISVALAVFFENTVFADPMRVEPLDRGLIAVKSGQGYYLSWRLLANEPYNTPFDIYRGTQKLNAEPITGATCFTDTNAPENSAYTLKKAISIEQRASEPAIIINSTEGNQNGKQVQNGKQAGYIHIDLKQPEAGIHGGTYSPGDGSVGDLDGDGKYEIVLKWDPSNAKDNAHAGITDNVLLDAYTLSGKFLWRIDLGQNIRAGSHYTQFLVYDFDGCGKAEVMMKTAPGTKDSTGKFLDTGPAATADHDADYHNDRDYILDGPEFLTVFAGQSGKELATVEYLPVRGAVKDWGDNYGNRLDRYNAAVAYLDGKEPSAVFQRGYYTRMTLAAWDWRDGKLTKRWFFDSNDAEHRKFAGQGNHSVSVADVDNDGKQEIITGSAVIGSDGKGMHTTGLGHGDALHAAHMIKGVPTPQIFMPHESGGNGVSFRHAHNGEMIFQHKKEGDIGRGCAGDIDPAMPGFKFWGTSGLGLYDVTGKVVGEVPRFVNHVVWWDGDLSRELLNGNQVVKWSIKNNKAVELLRPERASSVNGTKANPVLQADLFGDWREEIVLAYGTSALRIYTTAIPTEYRLVTLMHDPVYRAAVSWQNSSYNQPPHPGYYMASDMDFPPPVLNVSVGPTKDSE